MLCADYWRYFPYNFDGVEVVIMGVNRKFCYTEDQCKFAEEVIRTLSGNAVDYRKCGDYR